MTDLSCGRFLELLAAHPEGRLSTAAGVAFPAHAARCATCRAEAESSERLLRLERAAFLTPAEDELPESLVQAILAATDGTWPLRRLSRNRGSRPSI